MSEPTYTVEIIFHGAYNLPVADLHTLASDPYIHATLVVPAWDSHTHTHGKDSDPEHPPLTFRTPTIRRTRNAEWCPPSEGPHTAACTKGTGGGESGSKGLCVAAGKWLVGGVPASGFVLDMRLRDEDPGNRDDRLGRARVSFPDNSDGGPGRLKEGWESLQTKYAVKKRRASPKTYLQTTLAAMLPTVKFNKHAYVELSVRVVGKTEGSEAKGRVFTVGPARWSQHFSPLIGAVAPSRAARPSDRDKENVSSEPSDGKGAPFNRNTEKNLSSSTFISNKLQLTGPVPHELRNEFVGFRPLITWMFKSEGVRGMLLNRALKKQYRTIYSYDKNTRYGVVTANDAGGSQQDQTDQPHTDETEAHLEAKDNEGARRAFALQFLRMTSFGAGGRMFTYVITLDGEWRWTETGEEFAVDLISKHTMHADVNRIISWSGEFFVRRLVDKPGGGFESAVKVEDGTIGKDDDEKKGEEERGEGEEKETEEAEEGEDEGETTEDPAQYELVIDNDSGTYRPPKDKLPVLRKWLADDAHLGALGRVTCVDGFDPGLQRAKKARATVRKRGRGAEDDKKKGDQGAPEEGKKGPVARAKQAAEGVESKVMAAVGKDESHAKGKGGEAGRMALPRSGSSVSSIGSGILGAGRRGSVSSDEVKDALAKAEDQAASGGQGGPSHEAPTNSESARP